MSGKSIQIDFRNTQTCKLYYAKCIYIGIEIRFVYNNISFQIIYYLKYIAWFYLYILSCVTRLWYLISINIITMKIIILCIYSTLASSLSSSFF